MTEELEFDVIENPNPQPKIFCYKFVTPTGESGKIGVISMSSTDAKEGLKARLPVESELTFLLQLDSLLQV